jgi:hypothetical protein
VPAGLAKVDFLLDETQSMFDSFCISIERLCRVTGHYLIRHQHVRYLPRRGRALGRPGHDAVPEATTKCASWFAERLAYDAQLAPMSQHTTESSALTAWGVSHKIGNYQAETDIC